MIRSVGKSCTNKSIVIVFFYIKINRGHYWHNYALDNTFIESKLPVQILILFGKI